MIFLLTGGRQIGKTRWLEAVVVELVESGARVEGVLAPGVWIEKGPDPSNPTGEPLREKLGIDNVLLPQMTRIAFARRRDLAQAEGSFDASSQSARAGLSWEMPEDAIEQVNAHLATCGNPEADLIVIDELGPLELLRGGGLTEAIALLDRGPSSQSQHALIIVRPELIDIAEERFADKWGDACRIAPDESGYSALMSALD